MPARPLVLQFGRFALVGVANTLLSLAVYDALVSLGLPYPLAGAVGFSAGAVNGYLLNRRWTFARPDSGRARGRYLVVQLAGLAATSGLLWAIVNVGAVSRIAGYVVTVPPVTAATFAANRAWTFA